MLVARFLRRKAYQVTVHRIIEGGAGDGGRLALEHSHEILRQAKVAASVPSDANGRRPPAKADMDQSEVATVAWGNQAVAITLAPEAFSPTGGI